MTAGVQRPRDGESMAARLVPYGGATWQTRCPGTSLSWHEGTLTAADAVTGQSVSLTPAALYHYCYGQEVVGVDGKPEPRPVSGLAALDADGLVLLDLPGAWHAPFVHHFTVAAGLPVVDARRAPSGQVRAVLAGRAPGWRRLSGLPRPWLWRWRLPIAVGAGVAGLALMTYLAMSGAWLAWRGIASLGRLVLDLVDAKWLAMAFSPLLLVVRPVAARMHRLRTRRGTVLGPPGGPHLQVRHGWLHVTRGKHTIEKFLLARAGGLAAGLLVYRCEGGAGLVVTDRFGHPLHHLPGPWPHDDVHRFATRNKLELRVRSFSRAEYVALIRSCRDASP